MENFKLLIEMLNKIHGYFIEANQYFIIWQSLEKLANPNEIWLKMAQENVDVMNKFKTFFVPIKISCKEMYLLELAKCFDTDKDALSIQKVLSFSIKNIKEITYENYRIYKGSTLILSKSEYDPITLDSVNSLNIKIRGKSPIIRRLMNFRNQYLAHNSLKQIKEEDVKITLDETKELLEVLTEIWNKLGSYLVRETWWHNFSDKTTYEEIKRLLNYLHRFEPYRIKEIQKESQKRLSEYKKRMKNKE
jgi:hypothetical protein